MRGKNLLKQLTSRLVDNLNGSKGSILIIAIWSICLLSAYAVILGYQARQKLTLAYRLEERDKLRFIAEAGITKTIIGLKEEEGAEGDDTFKDEWRNNPGIFKEIEVGDGKVDICYNYIDDLSQIPEVRYGLIDEERKININKIDRDVLERFFKIFLNLTEPEAREIAAAIIDWRDNDSEDSIHLASAEDAYYKSLPYPYEAKDQDFDVIEEILLVKGIENDIFEKIKDYITIYGDGKININTASKIVLFALGLDEDIIDKVILFRAGEDKVLGTSDDNFFDAAADITSKLSQFYLLSNAQTLQLAEVQDQYLGAQSHNLMIKSITKLNNKKNTLALTCVLNSNGGILYWREY